jgi:hypothetical protein
MEIIIYLILAFAVGVALGYARGVKSVAEIMIDSPDKFREIMNMARKAREGQQLDEDMENDKETVIDIDREGGQYYAYASTGEFLAQAQDFRAMFELIKKRFPGRTFRINKYNAKLTEEETQRMIRAVFESFGEKIPDKYSQNS